MFSIAVGIFSQTCAIAIALWHMPRVHGVIIVNREGLTIEIGVLIIYPRNIEFDQIPMCGRIMQTAPTLLLRFPI